MNSSRRIASPAMIRRIKSIWLMVTFLAVVIAPAGIGWYVREEANPERTRDPLQTAQDQWAKKNYDGAVAVYDYVIANDLADCDMAEASRAALIEERDSWSLKLKSGLSGYVTGNVEDGASLVGCVLADLTVVGDVRDLAKQGYRKLTGGEVDQFNAALAAAGLAMTLAPEIGAGIACCKEMMKFMGTALKTHVIKLIEIAKETKSAERLLEFSKDVGKGFGKIGTGMFDVVRGARDAEELKVILKIIEAGGKKTYAVLLIGGRGARTFVETAVDLGVGLTGPAGKKLLKFGLQYPQLGIRVAKISKKLGYDHLGVTIAAIAEGLAFVPVKTAMLVGLAVWLWFHWLDVLGLLLFHEKAAAAVV